MHVPSYMVNFIDADALPSSMFATWDVRASCSPSTIEEKTTHNKKTQHAIGLMKAQLASLKDKLAGSGSKKGGVDEGYAVKKSGDATVVLLGFPSNPFTIVVM